jgi:N6-L-threonylcarbamoyladenine synthase
MSADITTATAGNTANAGIGPETGRVLAIETSCDETAASVVRDGLVVESSVVSSQIDLHARFGGVVPEIASRAHVELIVPVVAEALERAGLSLAPPISAARPGPGRSQQLAPAPQQAPPSAPVTAVAATIGPGLIGALLVGVSAAKSLALAWDVPFVGVNHLEGHLYACLLDDPGLPFPAVVLLVSGGHTILLLMEGPGSYRILGQTIDDAAGEAFDKVARYLGLGYPGGPLIDKAAGAGDADSIAFPRARLDGAGTELSYSFSGLKTAVVNHVRAHPEVRTEDVAASFQKSVVEALLAKAMRAVDSTGARSFCLAGGVAANSLLRARAEDSCRERGVRCFLPSRAMCTDNAAMIGAAAWWRLLHDGPTPLSVGADPNLRFPAGR